MNRMNVNGQNGVATSALKNAVDKAVKMINNADNAKRGYVKIDEDMRLSFDGIRFIRGAKDNFIFNGKIEQKCGNGRYDEVFVEIHYKNLDNEEGLCLNDMINGVLDAILVKIDNWIIDYYKNESEDSWVMGLEKHQDFRNKFFGSKLVVDNTEDLNSPDTLDDNMTIREYLENNKESDGWGGYVTTESIYNSDFATDEFRKLADCTAGWASYVNEDADGDLFVCGNENAYLQYFDDDVPMIEVVEYLIKEMKKEIIKTETEIENEIEGVEK